MLAENVPAVLRERLGDEATAALLEVLDRTYEERKPEMITAATERFERRLVEEASAVRVQIAQVEGSLRQEIAHTTATLRQEIAQTAATLRQEITQTATTMQQEVGNTESRLRHALGQTESALRQDMGRMESVLRQDMSAARVELFKWSFLFWIGQVLALAGFFAVMLRVMKP